jgi:NADH:ubiquinone oxidoreductase subunit 5 (subunit L)/multisubunit Na+/H+ antiporter MnhA subunit
MVLNRVGDFGLALAIFSIYFYCQSLDYGVVFSLIPLLTEIQLPFLEMYKKVHPNNSLHIDIVSTAKSIDILTQKCKY